VGTSPDQTGPGPANSQTDPLPVQNFFAPDWTLLGRLWSGLVQGWMSEIIRLSYTLGRVPNGLGGLQSFGARHRRLVRGMSFGGPVRLGEKTPGPGPVQMTVVMTRARYSISGSGVRVLGQKSTPHEHSNQIPEQIFSRSIYRD
jgi:hypothetical protein